MFVREILSAARQRLARIGMDATLAEVATLLSVKHTNLVVVCDSEERMIGVITDSDIVRYFAHCRRHDHPWDLCATTIMTHDVISCRPEDQLHEVWATMRSDSLRHIPVIGADQKPIGILYARDALKSLLKEVHHEEDILRDYILGTGFH